MNYQFKYFLILLLLPFTGNAIDLQSAISQKLVRAQFLANGGHRNKCLKLIIENKQSTPTKVKILPGTYLENKDTNRQDIIMVENNFFCPEGQREKRAHF